MEELAVEVYPNPVVSSFSVEFSLEEDAEISIRLLDVKGRLVIELLPTQKVRPGTQHFNLVIPNGLAKGTYLLTLNFEGGVVAKQLFLGN